LRVQPAVYSAGGRSQTRIARARSVYVKIPPVTRPDDDDDWVGTPPEGRYTRDRAKPEFWWRQKPIVPAFVGIFVVVVVIVIVALLS
jgi:hypothetical protein